MPDDNIIDDAVVRVSPDLTGFGTKLKADLKKATNGIEAKVRLVADATGFATSARAAIKAKNLPEARIRLVADTRGFDGQLRRALRDRVVNVRVNVIQGIDTATGNSLSSAARQAENQSRSLYRRVRTDLEKVEQAEEQSYRTRYDRTRGFTERIEHLHAAALREEERRNERHNQQVQRENDRAARLAEQAAREAARRRSTSTNALLRASEANGIIDLGGAGVRPTNLLVGALVALSPALLSAASSAAVAGSSIAALGAASIGTAGAVTAVTVGFTRIREALSLRAQARKEEQRAVVDSAANARAERNRLHALADARRRVSDAERVASEARKDLNEAYREAAKYVRDLREELSDLALQEQQDTIDVATAKQRLAEINDNYWATDLEKRQAALDVQKAIDRQGDTKRERVTKSAELARLEREGLEATKQVTAARRRVEDANRAVADARRAVTDAQADVVGAYKATSAASQDLAAQLAAMSPAARDMYQWFLKNEGTLDRLRSKMEQAILPGFLTFLENITDRGRARRGSSALDIMADGAARLGKIVGDTVGRLGALAKSPWFRSDMVKVNKANEKSFTLLGKATETVVRPISRIVAESAPLLTKFSGGLLKLARRFDTFIEKAANNGSLTRWFRDAATEAGKWADIIGKLGLFLRDVFTANLPSGRGLVERIRDAVTQLQAWSSSKDGQASIKRFFDYFANLDYARIGKFVADVASLITALKLFTFARKHPFITILGLLASSDLEFSARLLAAVSNSLLTVLKWVQENPKSAAAILAILTAARYTKSVDIGVKLLGFSGLGEKIAGLFGKQVATMTVNAGVVNVLGGAGAGGAPGMGGKGGKKFGGAPITLNGVVAGTLAVAAAGSIVFKAGSGRWPWESKPAGPTTTKNNGLLPATPIKPIGESEAFQPLRRWADASLKQGMVPFRKNDTAAADASETLQRYVISRKAAVKAEWFAVASKKGTIEANKWLIVQEQRSVETLGNLLRSYGWTADAADAYARKAYDVEAAQKAAATSATGAEGNIANVMRQLGITGTEAERYARKMLGIPEARRTKVDLPGIKAREKELRDVNAQLEKLAGPKTAKVTVEQEAADTKKLDNLLVMQLALNKGISTGKARLIYEKDKRLAFMHDGGPVRGFSAHPRADNIPAMLTAKEYVQPVSAVKKYGVQMMDDIRTGRFPRYADGGQVWPFKTNLSNIKTDFATADGFEGFDGPIPKFGKWPSSPRAQRGNSGVWRGIVKLIKSSGIKGGRLSSAYRHGDPKWHGSGRAVDWAGYNQDALATWLAARRPLELIHRTRRRDYAYTRGRNMGSFNRSLMNAHRNHIHIAMADGGLVPNVPIRKYDTGGGLAPGATLAINNTGRTETVRTHYQEKNLNTEPRRIDKRDLMLLAQYISAASARPIHMDGRKVAEIVSGYTYLPGGA